MAQQSAGLMMFRHLGETLQIFLVHPGGPFWAKRDQGVWGIPKGERDPAESALGAAQREFHEETGFSAHGPFLDLGQVRLSSGKIIDAWAFEGDCDPLVLRSNTCRVEWPPRSGRTIEIEEVDRGQWFTLDAAEEYMSSGQRPFVERLRLALGRPA